MRLALGILLALVLVLAAAWSGASLLLERNPPASGLSAQRLAQEEQRLATAQALNPANAAYQVRMAELALAGGPELPLPPREALASSCLRQASLLSPSWEVPLLRLANLCAGHPPAAAPPQATGCQTLYLAALQRNPTYGYAHYRYADFLYDQALAAPRVPRGQVGVMCRRYGQALHLMRPTLRYDLWYRKAQARAYARCLELASGYAQARLLAPEDIQQWEDLGQGLASNLGEMGWSSAREAALRDLAQAGGLPGYKHLARGLIQGGLPRAGEEVLRAYISRYPSDPAAWQELLRNMLGNRAVFRPEEVIAAVVQARQQASFTPEQLYLLAQAARRAGEVEISLSILGQVVAADPNNPKGLLNLGDSFLAAGRTKEAIGAYQRAVRLAPETGDYHLALGLAYARDMQFEAAVREIQLALDLNPQDRRAQAALRKMGVY